MPVYIKLFNVILDESTFPEEWLDSIIRPIYKGKGNSKDPGNYHPISLVSCFSKLFTSVLNHRIHTFLDNENILSEGQAGFRQKYSTNDYILHYIA